ncbi:hypothetical protein CR513_22275, partial [Mucuna pruriens]
MMGERSMFQDLQPKLGRYVTFGGNQKGKIVKIDKVGKTLFLSIDNVFFVKGLKHNMRISQLCENGHDVSFNKGECIVRNPNCSLMFTTKRKNILYKINLFDLTNQNKLGHASLRLISKLNKHNLVRRVEPVFEE